MGEKTGLIEDQLRHCGDVINRGCVAVFSEPLSGHWIAIFRSFGESKERLVATHTRTSNSESTHLSGRQIRRFEACRRLSKCAVAAAIPAEHGERDEHLRRICHPDAECLVSNRPGFGHQLFEWGVQPRHLRDPIGHCENPMPQRRRAK